MPCDSTSHAPKGAGRSAQQRGLPQLDVAVAVAAMSRLISRLPPVALLEHLVPDALEALIQRRQLQPGWRVHGLAHGAQQLPEAHRGKGRRERAPRRRCSGAAIGWAELGLQSHDEVVGSLRATEPGKLSLHDGQHQGQPLVEGQLLEVGPVLPVKVALPLKMSCMTVGALRAICAAAARKVDARPLAEHGVPGAAAVASCGGNEMV
mmetsp:Transcript_65076/g.167508  ORF Transcript_65076/g.167508 Transcript_65076/m.167508 type:complete len:207 (-) Transcript_65076:524-1144(-)